jgi:hypothetical protein
MWFLDKFGHGINSGQLISLFVAANPDSSGYYVVQGNNAANTLSGQFAASPTMSEADANSLLTRMLSILGTTDLAL